MDNRRWIGLLVATAISVSAAGCARAADWSVAPDVSSVTFSFQYSGTKYDGRFATFAATVDFDPAKPAAGKIVGTVQTASVNTRDSERDVNLVDRDWFNAKEFPEARFESQSIEAADGGFRANGQLTIKGRTNPAVLAFTFSPAEASSAQPSAARLDGTIQINRFDYNVGEGWNDTSWVGEKVSVQVKLDLKR